MRYDDIEAGGADEGENLSRREGVGRPVDLADYHASAAEPGKARKHLALRPLYIKL